MTQGQFQNDQWTVEDHLELASAADQVTRTALVANPPFTIGVIGKWGSGKTSILKRSYFMLDGKPLSQSVLLDKNKDETLTQDQDDALKECKHQLKESHGISNEQVAGARCIWFSPWQYQNEDNPLIALLKEIRSQFTRWQKLKDGADKVNRRGGLAALALIEKVIDAATAISPLTGKSTVSGTTDAVRKAWKEAEPNLLELSDGQRFHLLFEDAVETVLSADKADGLTGNEARLIIFIDDLDRCEGEQVVRLLEAIKLYLSCNRCVFVLGLDESAVLNALCHHWSRGDEINREYLEKLFQSRVSVPLPSFDNIQKMVAGQLGNHPSIAPYKDALAKDIASLCEPNPRKVKNFGSSTFHVDLPD